MHMYHHSLQLYSLFRYPNPLAGLPQEAAVQINQDEAQAAFETFYEVAVY